MIIINYVYLDELPFAKYLLRFPTGFCLCLIPPSGRTTCISFCVQFNLFLVYYLKFNQSFKKEQGFAKTCFFILQRLVASSRILHRVFCFLSYMGLLMTHFLKQLQQILKIRYICKGTQIYYVALMSRRQS